MRISETATTPVTAFCTIKLNIINILKTRLKKHLLKNRNKHFTFQQSNISVSHYKRKSHDFFHFIFF